MRYFVELAYKGTAFCGWQLQPDAPTVQGTLEQAAAILLRAPVRFTGAGRTDTGVHASYFVAHFDAERDNLHLERNFLYQLNRLLPYDIAVFSITPVAPTAHARFDAIMRTYCYRIAQTKNPFTRELACHYCRTLDIDKMNEAAALLLEHTDFTSFCKLHSNAKNNLCAISHAQWNAVGDELHFTIKANRFLRNMVRAIVGTMIEIGLGKYAPLELHTIITAHNRNAVGTSAPPEGLYLTDIHYPETVFVRKHKKTCSQ